MLEWQCWRPFHSIIPSVVQYLSSYILPTVDVISGPIIDRHFSVLVHEKYFNVYRIMYNDAPLEPNASAWQAIYCMEGDICGYATNKTLDNGTHHI